jgi:DNA repair protein RecN (Recombination protein N)
MLLELRIKNFVIIDDLIINFKKGLNILSGETGAGKSILIDALSGILGEKMTTDIIRTGFEKASLEGLFDIEKTPQVKSILDDSGIDYEDDLLVLRRELFANGRGRCYANSLHIPITKLREISDYLVDIHGQNEHQNIVKIAKHRELLDSFSQTNQQVGELRQLHNRLSEIKTSLDSFQIDEREKARRIEFNSFAIKEIDAAALKPDEEDDLKNESILLANGERLFTEIQRASSYMNGDDGIVQKIKKTEKSLSKVAEFDTEIHNFLESIRESLFSLEDVSEILRDYETNIDFSPQRINQVEERISLINNLKKKYGDTIEEILEYREKIFYENEAISSSEEEMEKLELEYKEIIKDAKVKAMALS